MKRFLVSAVFLGLAACGTPQQQCIGGVTRNLQVVDRLIAETEGNLNRGFAFANVDITTPKFVDCTPEPTLTQPEPRVRQCLENVVQTVSKPVAIDLNAEAAKLASLKTKRAQLATAAQPAIAACQRQYPE
jgi:hypothetical protein